MSSRQADFPFDLGVRAFGSGGGPSTSTAAERHDTVIVGGGQAGLATGYHLARRGRDVLILDENHQVGDGWRAAWDSLRLFTPARYDGLPGMPFPGDPRAFPTRDEMAAYLRAYAERFELPVRTGVAVDCLRRTATGGWSIRAGEHRFEASNVVVATGPHRLPSVPGFASTLEPTIHQLHSSDYRNPAQLDRGPVLVVGAAHSGPDIALEVAAEHATTLVGPYRGEIPFAIEGRAARVLVPVLWQVANHVLTVGTPAGRKVRPEVRSHGGPLIRVKARDLERAGVVHHPAKVVGAQDGLPLLADGRIVETRNVIWCTGFRLDFSWIDPVLVGEDGYPREDRGVVPSTPGLYFVGLPFQRTFASMLIGGVGSDAAHVAAHIASREPARMAA